METKKDLKGRKFKQNEDQMKDGRYRYRYTDKYGIRHAVYSWKLVPTDKVPQGKKDCKSLREKEVQIIKDNDDGITRISNSTKVSDLVVQYLSMNLKIRNSTRINYEHMLNKNIKNHSFGKMKVTDVKKSDVKKYYTYLYTERKFAPGTIQLYQNLLFPAFQVAVDDEMIRNNPCKNCMKDFVRGGLSSTKSPLSRSEQVELLKFAKNNNIYSKYYPMIAFMLSTGCRIGEVIGMTWEDIDFENKCVNVTHQMIYKKKDGKTQHYSELPKNGTTRSIPVKEDILAIMRKHKDNTYFTSISNDYVVDGYSNFVFLNSQNTMFTPNTIVRTFHELRDAHNQSVDEDDLMLPDFSPHTLRHTFCTRMAENGMDIKVLQEIMGHKTIAVTMQVYNHVNSERAAKAVQETSSPLTLLA